MSLRLCLLSSLFLLISACANQPLYGPASGPDQPGYSETQLADDRFRVTFTGFTTTTADEVKNYAMLRAAEITTSHGYDWFKIVSQDTYHTDSRTEPRVTIGVAPRAPSSMSVTWLVSTGSAMHRSRRRSCARD